LLRSILAFLLLLTIKVVCLPFWRIRIRFVGDPPPDPWKGIRLVALLNHTSLYEPVFAAGVPLSFLWRLARHGVVPIAEKTIKRPVVGWLFRLIARHPVSISRERDHTWAQVLSRIEQDSMVVILPEGRMKRANGLDLQGKPMTVRGGIADILMEIPRGRMLLAYSGGLHHIQVPGQHLPKVFRSVGLLLESVEIADYRAEMQSHGREFKIDVRDDLEERRDRYCPQAAELAGVDYV
jgi:hypothetical protein